VARRAFVLLGPWLVLGCGQVDTAVGVELARDAAVERSEPADAAAEADAPRCTGDLSNVGTGDFQVSLTVTGTQTGLVALVSQRASCAPSVFWDIRMQDGLLFVEVDDVTRYTALQKAGPAINDGLPHRVTVDRVAGTLTAYVDGVEAGSDTSPESLGALPAFASGTDVCVTSSDGTAAFVGQIANVCVGSP